MAGRTLDVVPEAIGAWLSLPSAVEAPSAADKSVPCIYRLGTTDVVKMASLSVGSSRLSFGPACSVYLLRCRAAVTGTVM